MIFNHFCYQILYNLVSSPENICIISKIIKRYLFLKHVMWCPVALQMHAFVLTKNDFPFKTNLEENKLIFLKSLLCQNWVKWHKDIAIFEFANNSVMSMKFLFTHEQIKAGFKLSSAWLQKKCIFNYCSLGHLFNSYQKIKR